MSDLAMQRRTMVDSQLRPQGVNDPAVVSAFASVPREDYVPERARAFAYLDRSIALRDGRWMMSPAALGALIQALGVRAGDSALVVASTGYAAALLKALGASVTEVGLEVATAPRGPFDLVLVEGAIEEVPAELHDRLAASGRMAAAIAERGVTRLAAGGPWGLRVIGDADVPILPGFARPQAFSF